MADTVVATIKAVFGMDYGQFTRGARAVSQQADGLAGKLGKVGTVLKTAFGAYGAKQVLDFGIAMYKVGMQSEAFGRKYRAVFGDNTAQLDAWVDAHHESFGVATDEVQGYLAQIGNLLTGMGNTTDQAGQQATKIMELAGAWSAWSGGQISVQDASDKLVKGMMGQTRGLIELGLKVTEEEVNARMAMQGLDKLTGAEASRAQQQVMWTLIQEKSTTAVGAYDEALGGAYGAAMSMATAVDEMKDRIGELVVKLAPAVTLFANLLGFATDFATFNWRGVSGFVQEYLMAPMPTPANAFSVHGATSGWKQLLGAQSDADAAAQARRARLQAWKYADAWIYGVASRVALERQAGRQPLQVDPYGFGLRQGNYEMVGQINQAIDQLVGNNAQFATGGTAAAAATSVVERMGAAFGRLPSLISEHKGDVQAAIADLIADFRGGTTYESNLRKLAALYGQDFADELRDAGDTPEMRAAAVYFLQHPLEAANFDKILEMEMYLARMSALPTPAMTAETARWNAVAAAWGAAAREGWQSGWGGPLTPTTPGGFVPSYDQGGNFVPPGGNGGGGGGAPIVNVHAAGSILTEGGLVGLIEDAVIRIMGRGGRSSAFDHAGASSVHVMT